MKRKKTKTQSATTDSAILKKKKTVELLKSYSNTNCPLNLKSCKHLLESMLSPVCSVDQFFNEYWEKKPLYVAASSKFDDDKDDSNLIQLKNYFQTLFNLDVCKEIMDHHQIFSMRDVVMCKYVAGRRINLDANGPIKFDTVKKHFLKDKMTLQFHQPQRFHDELWKIQEMLECFFGCLIGSNIYMTPENSQGLAPHHDNVEVFILQLEGSKVWKLYKPIDILPKDSSADLTSDDMASTELIQEITMNVGDVLYFPRGTIHQAKVLKGAGNSTHITLSAYATNSWQDYFLSSIQQITGNENNAVALRSGLPRNYHDKNVRLRCKKELKQALQALISAVENFSKSDICDELASSFFANRLPPFSEGELLGAMPSLDSSIRFIYPHHVILSKEKAIYEINEEEVEDEEDEFEEDEFVYVYHSFKNTRTTHMCGSPNCEPNGLKFASSCWDGLIQLHKSSLNYIPAKKLNLPDEHCTNVLISLWSEGLIEQED